jgi:tetratricopeptide (TPR) repeat protein
LVAENPEREQVIYTMFSPENLITFDEVWSVIDGFGNEYFIKVYKKLLQTDKRPRLKKYFRYFLGKLYLAEGNEKEAFQYFQQVLNDPDRDDPYQTLLLARVYEGLAEATGGTEQQNYTQQMYQRYPQLVPFSDLTMSFQLHVAGQQSEVTEDILSDLKKSRIDFTKDENAPLVSLDFAMQGEVININYNVQVGEQIQQGLLQIEPSQREEAGKLLAYRLFGIQKTKTGERPPAAPSPQPEKEKSEKAV